MKYIKGLQGNINGAFVGVYDFSYAPYALGDVITWQVNLSVMMKENDYDGVVQIIIPGPLVHESKTQPHITPNNYLYHLNSLFPAFLSCPDTRSINIVYEKGMVNIFLLSRLLHKKSTWPGVYDHYTGKLDFASHKRINKFFSDHGYLPRVTAPKGYEHTVDDLLDKHFKKSFKVAVNIRQRKFYQNLMIEDTNVTMRDSPTEEWYRFFRMASEKYSDVVFFILGGYSEWERELSAYKNIVIPRTIGMNLGHELAILHKSDLFIGTSSGFAAAATFSETPYIITNFLHSAAEHVGLQVGAQRYPFALDHQTLSWERETAELLDSLFGPVYYELKDLPARSG